ncbi:chemotaxis protein CheC [Saliterribacillus persicus]|uniref:Chemotaxis protein CheC n=1 Tax=Saliterribacillus persicus TaxID=930114 RepID=A0A368XXF5_9BACI|nr:chemotaxis protein CheC [Saliterribacillus persicus]RCW70694.1 chemotaxis protein CheC [Saliterribacillus persicus]
MTNIEHLTNYQLDILKEIGNIGSGNAATALSKLLDRKIDMEVPSVRIVDFNEIMEIVGGPEELIVSVFLRIQGQAPGNMFFVLSPLEAETFVRQITHSESFQLADLEEDEMALSALHEIGNILSGSYLSALSDFTLINMQPSVPSLTIDMAGAILMQGLMEISQDYDYAIIIDTIIHEEAEDKEAIQGHFFLLPDPESFDKIFEALGVNNK